MLTVQKIKAAANAVESHSRPGCWIFRPPVEVVDKATGEILHAISVDEKGSYPDTLHFMERVRWWDIGLFELKK